MIMAVAVATCSPTINARYGDSGLETLRSCAHDPPMIAGRITAWPRLDIGKSSVTPCRSPMTPASAYVSVDMTALRSPRLLKPFDPNEQWCGLHAHVHSGPGGPGRVS